MGPLFNNKDKDYDHEIYLITVSGEMEASIVETLLTSNNIPVLRKYREAGAYLKIYMGNSTAGIDLYVPSELYNIAKELIEKENEADLSEDNIQSEEEKELLFIEEKKILRRRSIRAWIILLFFVSGIAVALIYYLIMLLARLFR